MTKVGEYYMGLYKSEKGIFSRISVIIWVNYRLIETEISTGYLVSCYYSSIVSNFYFSIVYADIEYLKKTYLEEYCRLFDDDIELCIQDDTGGSIGQIYTGYFKKNNDYYPFTVMVNNFLVPDRAIRKAIENLMIDIYSAL